MARRFTSCCLFSQSSDALAAGVAESFTAHTLHPTVRAPAHSRANDGDMRMSNAEQRGGRGCWSRSNRFAMREARERSRGKETPHKIKLLSYCVLQCPYGLQFCSTIMFQLIHIFKLERRCQIALRRSHEVITFSFSRILSNTASALKQPPVVELSLNSLALRPCGNGERLHQKQLHSCP